MVRIVTDAAVRFTSPEFAAQHDVTVAPISIRCGNIHIPESPDVNLATLRPTLETCSPDIIIEDPTVEVMGEIYHRLNRTTNQIISIHTSSGMTGTYENALQASQQFRGRMDIQVIDSQSISAGLGLLVQHAVQSAKRGETFDTIIRQVRGLITRLYVVMFLEDLYFLERNHLVSRSQAILGNMLGIVPFVTIEDGYLVPMEKVRSRMRAVEKLIEFVSEFSGLSHLGLIQPGIRQTEETEAIFDRLRVVYPSTPFTINSYGPTLSAFVGLDCLGAVVLETEDEGFI
jgi:DegV family protein with EDD domain